MSNNKELVQWNSMLSLELCVRKHIQKDIAKSDVKDLVEEILMM